MRLDILDRKTEIQKWITENQSKAFISRQLQCKIDTLDSYLRKMNIVYVGNKSGRTKGASNYMPVMKYIQTANPKSSIIRRKLIREGIKDHECEICNTTEWLGQKIPLELDHIDGNHFNNEFANLRIICPNCHAMTSTNSGKNKGRYSS